MKVTIDDITYEGTVDEIRQIIENPPRNHNSTKYDFPIPVPVYLTNDGLWNTQFPRNWDGSPMVTC